VYARRKKVEQKTCMLPSMKNSKKKKEQTETAVKVYNFAQQ